MNDLWGAARQHALRRIEPLALRMRPRTLDEFVGQHHILGPGKLLRRMLEGDTLTSVILHGPPGTGKTSLAEVIASYTRRHFERESAAVIGVARIREIIEQAQQRLLSTGQRTVLFLDEIHRFSRAQQDALLGDVERGVLTLIGATTDNPLFACNSALVSRSTLFRLEPLAENDILTLLRRALTDRERGYGQLDIRISDEALRVWAVKCDGDARRALTALEVAVLSGGRYARTGAPRPPVIEIDRDTAEESIQQKAAVYDPTGDAHYDVISAFIKSLRGSDPDAALYWLARMLDAGEDPRFIARRLAILASEDIGNADPHALGLAAAAWELVERIGLPEARITLAQATTYLALAPKSNASYRALEQALEDLRQGRTLPVPVYLRDPHSSPGHGLPPPGQGYIYSHSVPGAITGQDYLGVERTYYQPERSGFETTLAERLEAIRRLRHIHRGNQQP